MKYELCVFDLDGTLVDTIGDLTAAMNYALTRNGYVAKKKREIAAIVGRSVRYMCQHALPPEDLDRWPLIFHDYNAYYNVHCCNLSRPFEGVLRALQALRAANVKLVVISNKPHIHAMKVITTLFPKDFFSMILGHMEKFEIKPDPASMHFVLNYFRVPTECAVYVGDSQVDLMFAKNANVDCIAVSWGLQGRHALETAGASCIIDDASELIEKVLGT